MRWPRTDLEEACRKCQGPVTIESTLRKACRGIAKTGRWEWGMGNGVAYPYIWPNHESD